MAANPNPARVTDEFWWFVQACLASMPGSQNGGTFVRKPGYHADRDWLLAQGRATDYSVRDAADRQGPGDKTAAFDWTFPDAQAGDYHGIVLVMDRFEAAFHARDPRTHGLREVLGQADHDAYAEGFDYRYWRTRTPDRSHLWHIHFSFDRAQLRNPVMFRAVFSIVAGESFEQWQQRGAVVAEYTKEDAIWAATFTGGSSCGPSGQVPAEHRGANDLEGNALVSQATYARVLLEQLCVHLDQVADMARQLLERPALALTDEQAAAVAARVGEVLSPRIEDAAARGAERALEGARVQVDLPPPGGG